MVNLGCFENWEDVPTSADDGDFFNFTNDSDPDHKSGIYYWNIRLVDKNGDKKPDWYYKLISPRKYRDDMMGEMLGAVNVNDVDGMNIYNGIFQTTDRELDRYYKKGLIKVASYLDKRSVDELPKLKSDDLIYEATICWASGLLYDFKTWDYTVKSFATMNTRYTTKGERMVKDAKETLRPLSKNKDKNDINRSGALASFSGRVR